ncbi:helix-turn-helix domain-containing protein [Azospirillum endophyticum]
MLYLGWTVTQGFMPKPRKTIFAPPYVEIIKQLQAQRRALGITQAELGEAYGEDQSFISRVERCQRRLDIHEYARICGLLGLDPGTLLRPISEEASQSQLAKKGDSPYDRRRRE